MSETKVENQIYQNTRSRTKIPPPNQCLGGRYRQFNKIEIRIQCNCDFWCTSRRKSFYNDPLENYPYYYDPNDPKEKKRLRREITPQNEKFFSTKYRDNLL